MSKNKKKAQQHTIPVGNGQRLVEELPPIPESQIIPPGIITPMDDPAEGVSREDVEAMRHWNEEHKM